MSKRANITAGISPDNLAFLEENYSLYMRGAQLGNDWEHFFCKISKTEKQIKTESIEKQEDKTLSIELLTKKIQSAVEFLQTNGNYYAHINCLDKNKPIIPDLNVLQFSKEELNTEADFGFGDEQKIKDILDTYKNLYCKNIGFEYSHLRSSSEKEWFDEYIYKNTQKKRNNQTHVLQKLIETEQFEKFLHSRFVGQKRFSLEGCESLIPVLDELIQLSLKNKIKEVVIGMPHRGRLNTLVNILKKPYSAIFAEFNGELPFPDEFDGDVKYHLGYSHDISDKNNNQCHVSLAYNPSHLEAVNSVVIGKMRAKSDISKIQKTEILGILMHGDASFCGQGVVAETFCMQNLDGYSVSGIIHIIVNNQIGFTTDPHNSRSTTYCSDSAKGFDVPVIHINGNCIDDILFAINLAFDFRQKFSKDIVIDIICYRKYGHNEGDDPSLTQSFMYKIIANKNSVVSIYSEQLQKEGTLTTSDVENITKNFKAKLEEAFTTPYQVDKSQAFDNENWKNFKTQPVSGYDPVNTIKTNIQHDKVISFASILDHINGNFPQKIIKNLKMRSKSIVESKIDWGSGEYLAFASLLEEGFNIRLSGQDSGRGTFSHRYAELTDINTGEKYSYLQNSNGFRGNFEVINSPLSEYAVLGFEYGYSLVASNTLTIWEAQFGDFANGAQIIVDQFISSAESKWMRASGLVLLLPHGYEGQGSEHSSARIERYLQLCAQNNMQIVNCTTPSNYFHVLRRQMHQKFRKPLIIATPKSLLRNKYATSSVDDFTTSNFSEVLRNQKTTKKIRRILICSGKIYYDLIEILPNNTDICIIRLEQLYPFPKSKLSKILKQYNKVEIIWVQEEPKNMGCFSFVRERIEDIIGHKISYIGRRSAASTSCGSAKKHKIQQQQIIKNSLSEDKIENGSVVQIF